MRYLYLVFGLLCGATAFAQTSNSTTFIIPDTFANSGSTICMPITAINFSSGVEFSFAIRWEAQQDGGALTFNRVQNLNPSIPFFGMEDFNVVDYVAAGLITVQWGNYADGGSCGDAAGTVTLDDGATLFEICFDITGPVATNHVVEFFNKPDDDPFDGVDDSVDIIFNKPPQCIAGNDAFPGDESGSVTIGVKPLTLSIPDVQGIYLPGDTYCVDVVAESGFEAIKGYQFGLQFDSTVIRSVSATANTDLFQNTDGRYNLFRGSSLYGVWAPFPDNPQTLPDGTTLVTVCFEVVGECGDRTDITVGEIVTNPGMVTRPLDANGDGAALAALPVIAGGTRLRVDNCNPDGFDVIVSCPTDPVNFGDTEVCVTIEAGSDFVDMTDIDYLINWDPDILEFVAIRNRNATLGIDASTNGDFDYDQTGNGILGFDWNTRPGQTRTLTAGDNVFDVCFNAIGFGGTSPIVVSDFRNNIESATQGFFDGINPTNCVITVNQPPGVAVTFPDIGFNSTQDNCFELEVTGFTNVTEATIYVSLSNALFDYRSFAPAFPGLNAIEIAPGLLQITLPNGSGPITVPDGGSLGTLCYRAQEGAAPGDCTILGIADFIPTTVVTTESEGNSVNVEAFNGEGCVLFPNGFGLIVGDTGGFVNDQVCVPVSVTRFTDVVQVAAAFNFDPTVMSFASVNLSGNWAGLTIPDFDVASAALGRIDLNWSTANPGGLNIVDQDTVQVFEICFDTKAEDGCTEVTPTDASTPATTTATGPGSIIYRTGEICIQDRLVLLNISTVAASCADAADGMIIFETATRPNNEDITIRTSSPIRFGNNGSVGGLLPGMQDYVIYNSSGLQISGSIEVGVNPDNAAVADAGDDAMLSCGDAPAALIGGRNNTGVDWDLFLVLPDGNGTRFVSNGVVAGDGNITTLVNDPGTYIFDVTSAAGCSSRDTVIVEPAMNPVAVAGRDTAITCNGECLTLTGEGSSTGAAVAYLWERIATDGTALEEVGTTQEVCVPEPGRYRLTVTFTTLMCSSEDVVIVRDENNLPNSTLPTEAALNCDGSPLLLSIGEQEENVVYTWRLSGTDAPLSASNTFMTSDLGTYVVDLENTVTGCSRIDTVSVVPSRGVPTITFNETYAVNCNMDTLVLDNITYTNVGEDTRYSWTTPDGRVVITDQDLPTPRVILPGTYQVVVANGACRDSATIEVSDAILPVVEAGDEMMLTCVDDLQLTGSASIATDDELSYQWFINGEAIEMGAAQSIIVAQPGTYLLEATSTITGCSAVDSVVISAPVGFPTYELADTIRGLGCDPTEVVLRVSNPGSPDYGYTWLDPSGTEIGTTQSVRTGEPGVHLVNITNPVTGCTAVDSVLVLDDAARPPFVSFRQNSLDITCEGGPAIIDAAASAQGPEFEYVWENITDGETPATQGNDTLRVRTAGVYRLTITNRITNCSNFRDVIITDSRVFPNVEAVPGMQLDCETRETVIGINILDQPNDYNIQWSGGNMEHPADTNRITVTTGGTYNAVVINPATSCVETVVIRVEDLIDSIATLAIMQPDSFDCNNATITIDASGSELNSAPQENIVWTSLSGNNVTPPTGSLIVAVDGPGDYELAVTDGSGCTVRDTVRVEAALDTPFAQAGDPISIDCGEMPQLDGSASTPAPGAGILYEWSASDGGEIVGETNTDRPFVGGPGTYQLIITNLSNGCADTSVTTVTLNEQAAAMLPADFTACSPPISVMGNLPAGTSGVWTAFNDEGSVWTAENNNATITEIGDGLSLVWTLSAGMGCENYSADTVRIGPEETPIANNDVLEVGGTDNIGSVNLLTNDQRTGPVTVTLLTQPEFGEIIVDLNGDVTFEAPLGFTGSTAVTYEVCSNTCPDLCSQATLTIRAEADGANPDVYNAITPNGDGMNDRFEFEILNLRPDEFPNNEIIIFNRWGDIIYEAKPYNNDWDGTSSTGALIPEGTYYYILRLDVGEGDIIRGDVTVIR